MGKAVMTPELRAKKQEAGRLGAAKTNALKAANREQAEHDQQTKLELNLKFDQELQQEIAALREHTNTLEQTVPGTNLEIQWDEWLDYGASVLRGCQWNKLYPTDNIGFRNGQFYDIDQDLEYKDQKYFSFYPDTACGESLLISYHPLSSELNQFLIQVLETFLAWVGRHPEQKLDHLPEIKEALQVLKNGGTLFREEIVDELQKEYQLEQLRIKQEQEKLASLKTILNTTARLPEYVPPDPTVLMELRQKAAAEEKAQLDREEELRRFGVPTEALRYWRGRFRTIIPQSG